MTLTGVIAGFPSDHARVTHCRYRSEASQALRTVVRYLHVADFAKRAIRLGSVCDQLRRVTVDLIDISAVRRDPDIARSGANSAIERSEGAVTRHFRAGRVLCNLQAFRSNAVAADIAVTEVRRKHSLVIRRHGQPAKLRRQSGAGIDLDE